MRARLTSYLIGGGGKVLAANMIYQSEAETPLSVLNYELWDFGRFQIIPDTSNPDEIVEAKLSVELYGDGVATLNMYDLIFIPVDEWGGELDLSKVTARWGYRGTATGTCAEADSIRYPKEDVFGALRRYGNDQLHATPPFIGPGPAAIEPGEATRLHFLTGMIKPYPAGAYNYANIWNVGSVRMWAQQRYLADRGDR
jgi:hypothetical protein